MTDLQRLDDDDGPARPLSDQQARALVRGALSRVIAGDADGRARAVPARRLGRAAIVIAGVLLGGAAVAGLTASRRWRSPSTPTLNDHRWSSDPSVVEAVTEASAAPAEETPPVLPGAEAPAARPPEHHKMASHSRTTAHAGGARASNEPEATGAYADDVLSLANQLRGQRRWRDAAITYQRVIATFPETDSAYVAMLARAELLLDHLDRPAEALGLFQRALAQPSGLLTEEARYGIATCYRALGDSGRERQALNAFLAAHPHSLLRASASARLAELR
ncbi:MAG TPA: tetratricopeptide repeat protein [Polyangia bacterium]|jgi:tetratricopeptide (TPR) repeat protein|nr:tetratricopeptide repeat protein [Polyangia bacterium]